MRVVIDCDDAAVGLKKTLVDYMRGEGVDSVAQNAIDNTRSMGVGLSPFCPAVLVFCKKNCYLRKIQPIDRQFLVTENHGFVSKSPSFF
jgi:predicted GNAT family acetyltransferase